MSRSVSAPGRAALINFECSGESLGIEDGEAGESNRLMDGQTDDREEDITANSHNILFTFSDLKADWCPLWCVGEIHI